LSYRLSPLVIVALVAAIAPGCGKKEGADTATAPEVVFVPVEKKDVSIYGEWVGTTTGFVNAKIYPKVQGYLLKQAYRDGGVVKAGDLLFEIDPRQYRAALDQATGQLRRAQAALAKSEQDVERYTPLAAQGAVSQQELDDAIQARAANAAQVDSARADVENARLELAWTRVESPIDGVAGIATAQLGDLVGSTTLLTSVSQLDPIKVNVQVSEMDYLRFEQRVREVETTGRNPRPIEMILANGSRYRYAGHFLVAGLAVAATTGTIEMQGVFPNPDNVLRPGQFAKIRAVTDELPDALVIPQRAVRDLQGVSQVAVIGADDTVNFRNVKLGPTKGSDYVVSEGLQAGDRVVVEGIQKIRDGMLVKPVPVTAAAAPKSPATAPESSKASKSSASGAAEGSK